MATPTLLNFTAINTIQTITSSPTPYTIITSSQVQNSQWDTATVYGIVFGILSVLLAIPGAFIAVYALRKHREVEAGFGINRELGS